ncbi:MAG: signal peptide peptidase SppA [Planctomycetota bacterium]|jgi:protease-4|nr:signal peptide peptidase SppA [Planctomycetota bacterium]
MTTENSGEPRGEAVPGPGPAFPPPPPNYGYDYYGYYGYGNPPGSGIPPRREGGKGGSGARSCLVIGGAILAGLIFFALSAAWLPLLLSAIGGAGLKGAGGSGLERGGPNVRKILVRPGEMGSGTIAIINVVGVIDGNGSPLEGSGMISVAGEQLRAAAEDDEVKVVLLQIDSPGGGLTASDMLYNEILRTRAKGKLAVAWASSVMASGGYYVAAASDGIMASPTATVGSVGVMLQHFQIRELLDRLGVKVEPVISGSRKDIGSIFREMTPEERSLLQQNVDHAQRRFVEVVAKGRGMDPAAVEPYADGRIFTSDEAKEAGLIDRIGYIENAIEWAEELAGEKGMRVIAYRRVFSLLDILFESGRVAVRETAREVLDGILDRVVEAGR